MPVPQLVHELTFDAAEYLPAAHRLHAVAPALVPMSVIDPAAHSAQSSILVDPLPATYLPAPQLIHDESVGAAEYLPAAHAVHVVAPAASAVFVIAPAAQSAHDATAEVVEYLPALHSVHVVAPALVPVFVIEPAPQSVHEASLGSIEYVPAGHLTHVFAPGSPPVLSVIEPAAQSEQYDLPFAD